jgi:two-component system, response regulator YesN
LHSFPVSDNGLVVLDILSTKYKITMNYLISYLLVLAIPIIVGYFVYINTLNLMIENEKRTSLALLDQSKNIIDKYLDEIDIMVKRIAFNGRVESFLNTGMLDYGSPEFFDLIDAYSELTTYRISNSLIKEFYVHSRNTDAVISTSTTYTGLQPPYFYGNFFKYGNMSIEEFRVNILDSYSAGKFFPKTTVYLNKTEQSVITYMQSIPMGSSKSRKGDIMVLLDESIIQKLISNPDIEEDGEIYVLDGEGKVLTSLSDRIKPISDSLNLNEYTGNGFKKLHLDGKEMFITYTSSQDHKWKYICMMPYGKIISKVAYIKRIILIYTCVCFLLGILLAWFLARKYSRPLKEIIDTFINLLGSDKSKPGISNVNSGYEFIKGSISGLISQSKEYQKHFEEQSPILRSVLYKRLLDGDFKNISEIVNTLSQIGISMEAKCFSVLIVEIQGYGDTVNDKVLKEFVIARMVVRDVLTKSLRNSLHAYDQSEDRIAVILPFQTDDNLAIEKELNDIIDENRIKSADFDITANYYVGRPYMNLADIHISYQEALRTADFNDYNNKGVVVWYKDIPKRKDNYYYPIEMESRLINMVKNGDKQEVEKLLAVIYAENFTKRRLSASLLRHLMHELHGTLVRIIESYHDDNEAKNALVEIDMQKSIQEVHDAVFGVYSLLCDEVARKRDNRNNILKGKVLEYINQNYMHSEFSITMLAARFKMSETYIYQFFKENMDDTFAGYLENLRAEKACHLLTTTDLSIEEISEQVGYTSGHSFRRAFKRYKGIIPSSYREQHTKE